jgi:hypothetical protein
VATNAATYAANYRTLWFGGQFNQYEANGTNFYQGFGINEFPPDPRYFIDPNIPIWQ